MKEKIEKRRNEKRRGRKKKRRKRQSSKRRKTKTRKGEEGVEGERFLQILHEKYEYNDHKATWLHQRVEII